MKPKVVVVGAGMAGLAATYALRKHGIDVTLFEAEPYPGGRVIRKEIEGFRVDLGANFFFETYETTRGMAEDLGVPLRRTRIPIHSGIYRNGRFHGLYGDNRMTNAWKTARTLLSFQLLSPKGLWQVARFARILRVRGDDLNFEDVSGMLDLDTGESAAEFFESNLGTEALDWLFGPGLSGYTFAHPEQVGAACAMAIAWQTGLNGVAWPCLPEGGIGAFRGCPGQCLRHEHQALNPRTPHRDRGRYRKGSRHRHGLHEMRRNCLRDDRPGSHQNRARSATRHQQRPQQSHLFEMLPRILRRNLQPVSKRLVCSRFSAENRSAHDRHEQRRGAGAGRRAAREGNYRCARDRKGRRTDYSH